MKGPTEATARLADSMVDPPNRFYRYPVSNLLLPLFLKTPIRPNHITAFHTLIGLLAAWFAAQGTRMSLLAAFALSEARMVLDCLDGVLARAKKISSPHGRTIDEIGDATACFGMFFGCYWAVRHRSPDFPAGPVALGVVLVAMVMAWSHDFYKRKFGAALRSGSDAIFDELFIKHAKLRRGEGCGITRFGYAFDWAQVVLLSAGSRRDIEQRLEQACREEGASVCSKEAEYILENRDARSFRASMCGVSLMSGDNAMTILNLGLLTGFLEASMVLALVYGLATLTWGIGLSTQFLQSRRGRALVA